MESLRISLASSSCRSIFGTNMSNNPGRTLSFSSSMRAVRRAPQPFRANNCSSTERYWASSKRREGWGGANWRHDDNGT